MRASGARRWARRSAILLVVGLVLNGLRLRKRATAMTVVPPTPAPVPDTAAHDTDTDPALGEQDGYTVVLGAGVQIDEEHARAAIRFARREGIEVLDLWPRQLDPERALDGLRLIDPAKYRANPLAFGRGGCFALVVADETLARAGGAPEGGADRAALATMLLELKHCAPRRSEAAVIDGLTVGDEDLAERGRLLRTQFGPVAGAGVLVPVATVVLAGAAVVLAPVWGLLALLAYCAQPLLALGGTSLASQDLAVSRLWRRPLRTMSRSAGSWPPDAPADDDEIDPVARRQEYVELLADGIESFFEERRDDCPLCGAGGLETIVRAKDEIQGKPGTFLLDRCSSCGHVFQNPRLSLAGLDFYYKDFYDGLGETDLEFAFASSDVPYRGRAGLVRAHVGEHEPKSWLDVGAGHGHFCLVAQDEFPETRFEGLDIGNSIVRAERRGWIDRAHEGMFPEMADDLVGRFDVVSMHHYLEHTREPLEELDAAARVIREGGHFLIEVPDPECRRARPYGRWWGPWFQPQHQHFVSVGNLESALTERGFTVLAVEREEAHQTVDFAFSLWLILNHLGPLVDRPWQPEPSLSGRLRRTVVFSLGAPFVATALLLDHVLGPILRRLPNGSNTYRLLARRDEILDRSP